MRFQIAQALAHFLWQGAAVAILLWVALQFLSGPKARYNACAAALALMCAAPVATFLWLAPRALPLPGARGIVLDTALPVTANPGVNWFEANAAWLFSLWLAGALILLARSAVAWWRARRVVTRDFGSLPNHVEGAARRLAVQLGAKRVRFRSSARVASALVFGWLKPIVVLPAAALGRLTAAEIEALLAHELAHVLRGDFLVNLLQTAAECVLFYHPLVWWVSARMREERELCCDDVAVAVCRDEVLYSRALLRLEELRMEPALAATGGRLAQRIRRLLVGCEAERMNVAPLFTLLLMLGVSVALFAQNAPPAPPAPPPPASIAPPPPPVAPPSDSAVSKSAYRAGGDVSKPRLVYRVEPKYTPEALAERVEGMVVLSVVVTPEGTATEFKVVKSLDKGLDAQAIQAVRQWKFEPGRKSGKPVPVLATIETTFLLDGPPAVPPVPPAPAMAPMPRPLPAPAAAPLPRPLPVPVAAPVPPAVPNPPEPAIAPEPPAPPPTGTLPEPAIAPEPPVPPAPPARGVVGGVQGGVIGGILSAIPAPSAGNSTELERRKRYAEDRFGGANTDRGKVYLHYGPPDEIESHPSQGKGGMEVWRYKDDAKSKVTLEIEFQDGKQVHRKGGMATDI